VSAFAPPPGTRYILHADMDAFYASIEQRDRPELRGLPVIVGANSARGVVAAASYEARKFGVRSAMPGFRARALCPQGVFIAPNMARYAEVSEQVHSVFQEFTPEIEPIALDEAFLDITGSERLFGGPLQLATQLKRRVRERTELTVTVAVAPRARSRSLTGYASFSREKCAGCSRRCPFANFGAWARCWRRSCNASAYGRWATWSLMTLVSWRAISATEPPSCKLWLPGTTRAR
jgi:hypothetical protein